MHLLFNFCSIYGKTMCIHYHYVNILSSEKPCSVQNAYIRLRWRDIETENW